MIPRHLGRFVALLSAAASLSFACATADPVERQIDALDDPERRAQAIDALVTFVRRAPEPVRAPLQQKVVYALTKAYRSDHHRSRIVSALALLADHRATEVFLAAIEDADRRGPYFDAAVRAVRALGEMGIEQAIPALIAVIRRARSPTRRLPSPALELAAVEALGRLADRRAVPALLDLLRADDLASALQLKRAAIAALGVLRAEQAIDPLLETAIADPLAGALRPTIRLALCRLGPAAAGRVAEVAAQRDQARRPLPRAIVAAELLGDLPREGAAIDPRPDDPPPYRLALAETRLRRGHSDNALSQLAGLAVDPTVPIGLRRHAVELIGWHGNSNQISALLALVAEREAYPLLGWAAALAFARVAADPAPLARALDDELGRRRFRAAYLPRLQLAARCGDHPDCYGRALSDERWRVQERAVLELARRGAAGTLAAAIADHFGGTNSTVSRALIVAAERQRDPTVRQEVARSLASALESAQQPPGISVRARCLIEARRRPTVVEEQR